MKKKLYEKPSTKVYELKHRTTLLQASDPVGSKSSINDWENGGTTDDQIFM